MEEVSDKGGACLHPTVEVMEEGVMEVMVVIPALREAEEWEECTVEIPAEAEEWEECSVTPAEACLQMEWDAAEAPSEGESPPDPWLL